MGNLFPDDIRMLNDDSHLQMNPPPPPKFGQKFQFKKHKNQKVSISLKKKEKEFIKKKISFFLKRIFFLEKKKKKRIQLTYPWRNAVRRSYYAIERNFYLFFFSIPDKVGCNRHTDAAELRLLIKW